MAYNFPIPAPPRTPTPPLEDLTVAGLSFDRMLHSPMKLDFDPHSLSPMDENSPVSPGHYTDSEPLSAVPSMNFNPLSPMDPNSLYSPVSIDSAGSQNNGEGKGPFNFQPTSLSKSPITKSVRTLSPVLFSKTLLILTLPSL